MDKSHNHEPHLSHLPPENNPSSQPALITPPGIKILTLGVIAILTAALLYRHYFISNSTISQAAALPPTSIVTYSPVADTYANGTYKDRNYATKQTIIVKDGSLAKIAYLKFNLSTLAGKSIASAKLRLKVVDGSKDIQNYKSTTTSSWDEKTLTWNNKPTLGATVYATTTKVVDNTWVDVDLTTLVQTVQAGTLSVAIDSTVGSDVFGFSSRETIDKPQLVVTINNTGAEITLPPPTSTVAPTPTTVLNQPTATPLPTSTPRPTATPKPTITPTLAPNATAVPTRVPTATLVPTARPTAIPAPTSAPQSNGGRALYLAVDGNDADPGDVDRPWKTMSNSLKKLLPGDTLYVHGGYYLENVSVSPKAGTANARVTVKAYGNERPVVKGKFWISGASYWTFDGINVTWPGKDPFEPNAPVGTNTLASGDHMVKFTGGATNWVLTNCEIWGAHSYAGISITGFVKNWNVNNCVIHDTYPSNSTNQDHLIYANDANYGVIEHNIFVTSLNGRGVKLGPPSGSGGPNNITIRYNTFYKNQGPANIQLSGQSAYNEIYGNIMVLPGSGQTNITENSGFTGLNNLAHNNRGWQSSGVGEFKYIKNTGDNVMVDPQLDIKYRADGLIDYRTSTFKPNNGAVANYGRYASDLFQWCVVSKTAKNGYDNCKLADGTAYPQ